MHERHELELIAEYADGIASTREDEARRLVAACTECAEEYRIQREVRSVLAAAPVARMTDDERLRIREGALAALAADPAPASRSSARTRRSDAWMRRWAAIGTVAAALFVAVGLAGPLGDVLGGAEDGDDTATFEAADQAEVPDVTGGAATGESERAVEDGVGEDGGMAALVSPEAEDAAVVDLGPVDDITLLEWLERVMTDVESRIAEDPEGTVLSPAYFNERERPVPECFDAASGPVVGVITAEIDGSALEVFLFLEPSGALASEAFLVDGCELRPLG